MSNTPSPNKDKLISEVRLLLGEGIIDLELDPQHYDVAFNQAISRYRQRSGNAVEESFIFFETQPYVQSFTLPQEVQEVRDIYRRTIGGTGGTGAAIDPFSLAFTNNIYMIQNPGSLGGTGSGFLATYDLALGFQELVGRMFGRDVQFTWDTATKKLTLHRVFTHSETICLHVYNARPVEVLLNDVYAYPWLRDYTIAVCKRIMGDARSKFAGIAGPQGGITLNGAELKAEAEAEFTRLEEEIKNIIDGSEGYSFIIG